MPKSAVRTDGIIEAFRHFYLGSHDFLYDHLRDPISTVYSERLFAVIYHYQVHESAIIGVDRAGSVEQRDAMLDREAAPGTDLGLKVFWEGDDNAGWNKRPVPRLKCDRRLTGSEKIDAARAFSLILRQRQTFEMR